MEKTVIAVHVPVGLKKEIAAIVKAKNYSSVSEFVRITLINAIEKTGG